MLPNTPALVQRIGLYLRSSTCACTEYGVQYIPYACVIPPRNRQAIDSCVLLSPAKVPRQVPFLPDLSRETVLSIWNSLLGDFFHLWYVDAESTTVTRDSISQGANNGGRVVHYLHLVLDSGTYNNPRFLGGNS
ncbi:hypothetical protein GGI35DRAFT_9595 [Trichoderma velutinum]